MFSKAILSAFQVTVSSSQNKKVDHICCQFYELNVSNANNLQGECLHENSLNYFLSITLFI